MTSNTASALADFFLHATIRYVCVDFFLIEARVSCASVERLCCNRCTYCVCMTLAKRTASIFDTSFEVLLRMTRCRRTPLTELLQLVNRKVANQSQLSIEHWRHVTWVKKETVTTFPSWTFWIECQKFRVKNVDKICTTHCATRMT